MTKKEMNELADMIVDKLLTTYIREQATWYTTSTMDDIYHQFKKTSKKRTKKQMTVENMRSPRGNQVPNQFIIWANEGKYFQSYRVIIAFIDNNGNVFLDKDYWDYSRTTGKYRNIFLGEKRDDTMYSIKTGEYELKNLN